MAYTVPFWYSQYLNIMKAQSSDLTRERFRSDKSFADFPEYMTNQQLYYYEAVRYLNANATFTASGELPGEIKMYYPHGMRVNFRNLPRDLLNNPGVVALLLWRAVIPTYKLYAKRALEKSHSHDEYLYSLQRQNALAFMYFVGYGLFSMAFCVFPYQKLL